MLTGPTDAQIIASIPDALPVGVWVARAPGGDFVYSNRAFQEIMGIAGRGDVAAGTYAQPYGIHDLDGALYPEDRMPFVRAVAEQRTVMADDIVIHRTDGERVNVRAYAGPVVLEGAIDHVVIVFFDITREVAAEKAQADSEERMHRAQRMESIGSLAGGIAHDFNNLLGAIRIIATTLMESPDKTHQEALETIESATQSAQELTRTLLDFAGTAPTAERVPLQLDDVVRTVTTLLERAFDPRYALSLELGAPRPVLGDAPRLEQVVMNLLINARDAMPGGGRVLVRTEDRGDATVLSVIDEGPGIAPEIQHRVFEPYFSTRAPTDSRGVGLGLATVYGVVSAHGGTIELRTSAVGAHFEVRLPALDTTLEARPDPVAPPPSLDGHSLRVWIVDDEPMVAEAAAMAVRAIGHTATVFHRGAAAAAAFRADPTAVDVFILDLAMPEMDGRRTYLALRDIRPDVAVVLASGYALNREAQALLDLGVRAFLDKPYSMHQLRVALARAHSGA